VETFDEIIIVTQAVMSLNGIDNEHILLATNSEILGYSIGSC